MALPTLTPEQREQALKKAAEARKIRADFKARLASGELTPAAGLDEALGNDTLAKTKVEQFLTALPGWGKIKAEKYLNTAGIATGRRLHGLGKNQLADLRSTLSA